MIKSKFQRRHSTKMDTITKLKMVKNELVLISMLLMSVNVYYLYNNMYKYESTHTICIESSKMESVCESYGAYDMVS